MTEENKTCDCSEKAKKALIDFCFKAGAVFVGALLAILVSASILKPKCPCPNGMMPPQPRMERPMPNPDFGTPEFQRGVPRGDFHGAPDRQVKGHRPNDAKAQRLNDAGKKAKADRPAIAPEAPLGPQAPNSAPAPQHK